jgi:hypothetical protein
VLGITIISGGLGKKNGGGKAILTSMLTDCAEEGATKINDNSSDTKINIAPCSLAAIFFLFFLSIFSSRLSFLRYLFAFRSPSSPVCATKTPQPDQAVPAERG